MLKFQWGTLQVISTSDDRVVRLCESGCTKFVLGFQRLYRHKRVGDREDSVFVVMFELTWLSSLLSLMRR